MFDVLTDKWIPTDEGKCGILELIENAHKLKEIRGGNPINEFALYRFLSAFLMDALQIETLEDRDDIFDDGKFDMEKVNAYVQQCKDEGVSFDIYDSRRPFMQEADLEEFEHKDIKSVGTLDTLRPTATNKRFFDKTYEDSIEMSDAEIMQYLVTPTIHPGEGNGYTTCISGVPVYAIIKGRNLFETLILCLVPKSNASRPYGKPYWRAEKISTTKTNKCIEPDLLLALTLPIRHIRIIDNKKIYYKGKFYFEAPSWQDPYVPYFKDKQGTYKSMKPKKEFFKRWTDILTLSDTSTNALKIVNLSEALLKDKKMPLQLITYEGLTSNSRYCDMRKGDYPLSAEYIGNSSEIAKLKNLASASDEAEGYLGSALYKVFHEKMPGMKAYGLRIFHENCDKKFEANIEKRNTNLMEWIETLKSEAISAFDLAVQNKLKTDELISARNHRGKMIAQINKMKGEKCSKN